MTGSEQLDVCTQKFISGTVLAYIFLLALYFHLHVHVLLHKCIFFSVFCAFKKKLKPQPQK